MIRQLSSQLPALVAGLSAGLLLGGALGYLYWQPASVPVSVSGTPKAGVENSLESRPAAQLPTSDQSASAFEQLEAEAIRRLSRRDYEGALQTLFEADLVVSNPVEEAQLGSLLEEAVRLRVGQLRAVNRLAEIDALYEQLTLTMPERAEYYLMLALHRLDADNPEGALPVLAQIQNHHQLGGRARELIEQIMAPPVEQPMAVLPLERSGDQFLVAAEIDGNQTLKLLIDTGAAVTVLNPARLARLGYDLGERSGRFLTAGGPVEAPVVTIGSLSLGDQVVEGLQVGALDFEGHPDVDGLLGMDFLRGFHFRVDQDNNTLVLDNPR